MKLLCTIALCLVFMSIAAGQQIVTLPDGSKAILKSDKTWEPLNVPAKTPEQTRQTLGSMKSIKFDDPVEICKTVGEISYHFKKFEFENEQHYFERKQKVLFDTKIKSTGHSLAEPVFVLRDVADYNAELGSFTFVLRNLIQTPKMPCTIELAERNTGVRNDSWIPSLKMPANKARKAQAVLAVAVYGYPVDLEGYRESDILTIVPMRFVVFNHATGDIYSNTVVPNKDDAIVSYMGIPAVKVS